ncbi:MAG: glycosyltransferase family 9 protein [Bacteroidales bacterium]|jgi:ADP-heptose:LPS heptosyltransferase|nr:glycosyltransferase family 9 protein [Bacteroidales bacterium]
MQNSENSISSPTILISRTDGIGDVVLTLPVAGIIRKHFLKSKILFLGKTYTEPIINNDRDIDKFLNWDLLQKMGEKQQIDLLRAEKIDVILHIFPSKPIARLAKKAKIAQRVATSHRIYNWLYCNRLINLSRRNSDLHEAQLNLQLLKPVIGAFEMPTLSELSTYINFEIAASIPYNELIDKAKFNLILHPKSQGSAREWGEKNFCRLITMLPEDKFKIFVCGTQKEGDLMRQELIEKHKDRVTDLTGKFSLSQYCNFISQADALIAASTGPLHISAILNKHSLGLFPPIRPMNPSRWQPLGDKVKVFCADKQCSACRKMTDCSCMQSISPEEVASYLNSIY